MQFTDKQEQPPRQFNYKRNVQKALDILLGILSGVNADNKLNEQEALTLDTWLRDQDLLAKDHDVREILYSTTELLSNNIANEELEDLRGLIENILDITYDSPDTESGEMNQLIGLIHGIVADKVINEKEIHRLISWVDSSFLIKSSKPVLQIKNRIKHILADSIITEEEKDDLLELLIGIVGGHWQETGAIGSSIMQGLPYCNDPLSIPGNAFCLTGKFSSANRPDISRRIIQLGGDVHKKLLRSTQYLIVGSYSSRDWKYDTHGNKIEKALLWHKSGHPITFINETVLAATLL